VNRVLGRKGNRFFTTEMNPATLDAGAMVETFEYQSWTTERREAKVGVGGIPASLSPTSLPDIGVGGSLSQALLVSNPGGGTYAFSLPKPKQLPFGLALSSAGVISGTPRAAGVYSFEVQASNNGLPLKPVRATVRLRVSGTLAPQPANQIASYRFEGNANDSTGVNHGVFVPIALPFVDGFVGKTASFQPVPFFTSTFYPYMVLPQDIFPKPLATAPRSFEAWFKTSLDGPILGQAATSGETLPAIYVGTNGHLHVSFFRRPASAPPVEIPTRVDDDQWHHVATTFDGVNQRVYLNGVLRATVGGTVDVGSGIYNYFLGRATMGGSPNAGRTVFRGSIDEVAIYSRALQPTEVTAIHASGPTGRAGLVLGNLPVSGTVGERVDATIPITDGASNAGGLGGLTVVAGALPFGLSLDATNRTIRGFPRSVGTFSFTLRATNLSGHSGQRDYTMTITGPVRAVPAGLRAWWRFEPNTVYTTTVGGSAIFQSIPSNRYPLFSANPSIIGAGKVGDAYGTAAGPGDSGSALNFSSGTIPFNDLPFTFETWFSSKGYGSLLKRIWNGNEEPVIWVGSDGLLRANLAWSPSSLATMVSPSRVDDGSWHHVAVSYFQQVQRLYINGSLVATVSGLPTGPGTRYSDSLSHYMLAGGAVSAAWDGIPVTGTPPRISVDETAVFSRSLSAAEVADIFASGTEGKSILEITPAVLPAATFGNHYSQTLTAPGATGAVTWAVEEGTLPLGLTVLPVGNGVRVAGTLLAARGSTFTLVARDGTGATGARQYTIAAQGAPAALPPTAMAWWRGERNHRDSLYGNRHGTALFGNPLFADVEGGSAFLFNISGGSMKVPPDSLPMLQRPDSSSPAVSNNPYTFEAWFATKSAGVILGRHSTAFFQPVFPFFIPPAHSVPAIYVGTDGKLHTPMFSVSGQPFTSSAARVDDGRFHHLAVTYDGSNRTTYLNGVAIGTVSGHTSRFDGATELLELGIGFNSGGAWPNLPTGWKNFTGLLDEITTYSEALSQSKVQLQFQAGSNGKALVPLTTFTLPDGNVDGDYSFSLAANTTAEVIVTGEVPPGLGFSKPGFLTGIPSTAGNYQLDVSLRSEDGQWRLLRCPLRINGRPSPRWADAAWYRGESSLNGFLAGETATITGSVSIVPGRVGSAFRFDTGESSLAISGVNVNSTGGSWSFESWFRAAGSGTLLSGPVNGVSTAVLAILPDGRLRLQPSNAGPVSASTITVDDDLYHHVAVVNDGGTYRVYLDGLRVEMTSDNSIPSVTATGSGVRLGGGGYRGHLDELQFYTTALSADQVLRIYAAGDYGKSTLNMSASIPSTSVGTPFSMTVTAGGAPGPFTFSLPEGRFPPGISMTPNGQISGSTGLSGTFPLLIEARAANGVLGTRTYAFEVQPGMRYRPQGLGAWWQAEGDFQDWSGGHDIWANDRLNFEPGIRGSAFSFDGSTDLRVPNSAFSSGEFTFETWVLAKGPGGILGQTNFVQSRTNLIHVGWDGHLYFAPNYTSATSDFVVSEQSVIDGSWHHVAMTFGGGSVSMYLDGKLLDTKAAGNLQISFLDSMSMGGGMSRIGVLQNPATTGIFVGLIDETATWFRKLSNEEIDLLARCGPNGKADGVFPAAGPLPPAVRGRPYPVSLTLNGAGAASLSLREGSLPDSLVLPANSGGSFGGAPAEAGLFDFTVSGISTSGLLRDRQRVDERFSLPVDPLSDSASYDLWIGASGLPLDQSMPGFRSSSDMPNLLRFAFNLSATSTDRPILVPGTGSHGLPWHGIDPQGRLVMEFVRRKAAGNPGAFYVVETGEDLAALNPLSLTHATVTSIDSIWERVRVVDPVVTAKRFGRIRLVLSPLPPGNLLQNGSGASPVTTGWNIIANGGSGWFHNTTDGHDDTPGFFRTSYGWCRRSQTIDLIAAGATGAALDAQPTIRVGEVISSFMNNNIADSYYIKVELRDANQNVLASWNRGTLAAPLQATTDWVLHQHDFTNYGPGVRYVYFEDGGIDNGYWSGPFGTYHDAASVEVIGN